MSGNFCQCGHLAAHHDDYHGHCFVAVPGSLFPCPCRKFISLADEVIAVLDIVVGNTHVYIAQEAGETIGHCVDRAIAEELAARGKLPAELEITVRMQYDVARGRQS